MLADQTASSTRNIDSLIRANSREITLEMENLDTTTSILSEIVEEYTAASLPGLKRLRQAQGHRRHGRRAQ